MEHAWKTMLFIALGKGIVMSRTRLLMVPLLSLLLGACAPTATSRSTGQVLDDAAITARVKTSIAKTEGIGDAAAINVDTYRGVVSLAGFVDNAQQKRKAEEIAMHVPGVEKVFNNLEIKR
jgi:hyperosmotically inducible protein